MGEAVDVCVDRGVDGRGAGSGVYTAEVEVLDTRYEGSGGVNLSVRGCRIGVVGTRDHQIHCHQGHPYRIQPKSPSTSCMDHN